MTTYDEWKANEPMQDPEDEPRCPECGNEPCICDDSQPRCEACGLPCQLYWRYEQSQSRRSMTWDFVSRCCEATVVDGSGRVLAREDVE